VNTVSVLVECYNLTFHRQGREFSATSKRVLLTRKGWSHSAADSSKLPARLSPFTTPSNISALVFPVTQPV